MLQTLKNLIRRFVLDRVARSILAQMVLGFSLAAIFFVVVAGVILYPHQKRTLHEESEQRARTLAQSLAYGSSSWVLAEDMGGLQEIIDGLAGMDDLLHVFVVSPRGQVLASTRGDVIGLYMNDPLSQALLQGPAQMRVLVDQPALVDVTAPVMSGQRLIGWVRVELSRDVANAGLRRFVWLWVTFGVLALVVATGMSVLLSARLMRGLSHLVNVASRVQRGRLDARVRAHGRDEIGLLGRVFDDMLDALQEQNLRFGQLAESVQEVFWIKDLASGRMLYVSPAFERVWGRSMAEVLAAPDGWLGTVCEEDRERLGSAHEVVSRQLAGGWDETYRIARPDGAQRWIHDAAFPVTDAQGEVYRLVGVAEDVTERRQAEENVQWLAHFDALTGLPNRNLLQDRIAQAINIAHRSQESLALFFLDLDNFKNVNDSLGHRIGDALLVEMAHRLRVTLRDGDTVSRLGGDEFILLLPGADADGAAQIARKLLTAVARPCQIEQHLLTVTPSIGIAIYPGDGDTFEELSKRADVAMYRAKRDGRNGYRFFTSEMQTRANRVLELENALRHALERDELFLQYQPQVSLEDGRIVGMEALLRWQHPQWGLVSPAEFVPVAEDSGQILAIGDWVLRTATRQLRAWRDSGLPAMTMSVNLSAVQLRHAGLPDRVSQILQEVELPPQYLELELTEGTAMEDPRAAAVLMDHLHERGVQMSIDDFGTGYSSLSYLKRFKVYKLKIDQSFVRDISIDPEDKAIVSAIISMAQSLGMKTIAEGVETAEQLAYLRERGCTEVQGFYVSKPLNADDLEAFVRERSPQSVVWWRAAAGR